jgi:DNA end-binding protein Ku
VAPRAIWRGHLSVGALSCAVALFAAASTSDRISFNIVNRRTGNRVRREYVDAQTGKPVAREDQVKGYEVARNSHIILEPEEIAAALPEGDKTLSIESFIPCAEVDTTYFDRPYYLTPGDEAAEAAFAVIREGMRRKNVAAVARTVLFRRMRSVLIRPRGCGLLATTLNFDHEVRAAEKAFAGVPELKIKGEMLDLAKHIIETKRGRFDPSEFDDRYDAALAELVRAKAEGREIPKPEPKREAEVVDLMQALRESAAATPKKSPRKGPAGRRKAS